MHLLQAQVASPDEALKRPNNTSLDQGCRGEAASKRIQNFNLKTKSSFLHSDLREEVPCKRNSELDHSGSQINFLTVRVNRSRSSTALQNVKVDEFLLASLKKIESAGCRAPNPATAEHERFRHIEPSPPHTPFKPTHQGLHRRSASDYKLRSAAGSKMGSKVSTRPTTQQSAIDQSRFNIKRRSCGKVSLFIKNGLLGNQEAKE